MANLSDSIFKGTIFGMIFGIPVLIGIAILSLPIILVSCITGIDEGVLVINLSVFAIAVFLVWLFSRFQIIENGIVALIAGTLVHTYFKWHPLACILIGAMVAGLLFYITSIKIGFWIKTILFSFIITVIVYGIFYAEVGLFPLPDKIWKISFFIVFFLENIFIRFRSAYSNRLLFGGSADSKKEKNYDYEDEQVGTTEGTFGQKEKSV